MSFGTLTVRQANGQVEIVIVDRPTLRIGRNQDNDLVLADSHVSGYHAEILADPSGCQILDLDSYNGTEIDGVRIAAQTPHPLFPGSRVLIGNNELVLGDTNNGATQGVKTSAVPTQAAALIGLELQPGQLVVDAGGTVVATIRIINRSTFVDKIDLSVQGLNDWATLTPNSHSLLPGDEASAQLVISPPRVPHSRAGQHPFEAVARSEKRPELRFASGGLLTINPYSQFTFHLVEPTTRTAWVGAEYQLQIRNEGNLRRPFLFDGLNDEGAFGFTFKPEPLEVDPGEERTSQLKARLKGLRLFGQPKTYPFRVSAQPLDESAPVQSADARLIQRPPLPPWLLITLAVLALLTLCGALAFALRGPAVDLFNFIFNRTTPVATVVAGLPTPDTNATNSAAAQNLNQTQTAADQALAQTQTAVGQALSQSATAVGQANTGTQTSVAQGGQQTQTSIAQSGQQTGTAIAASGQGSATALSQTQVAQASALAGSATANANTGATSIAATQTALALQQTQTALALPTPTGQPSVTPPPSPTMLVQGADQVIVFDRVFNIPVSSRLTLRGNEYASQDALFCFYQPRVDIPQIDPPTDVFYLPELQQENTISIVDLRILEGNSGITRAVVTVRRSSPQFYSQNDYEITYITRDGTATEGSDYQGQASSFRFQEGSTEAEIVLAIFGDLDVEPDETFSVILTGISGGDSEVELPQIVDAQAIVTILNDDVASPTPTATNTATATSTATATASATATSSATPETPTAVPPTAVPPTTAPAPPSVTATNTATSGPTLAPAPPPALPPAEGVFDCQPPIPNNTTLRLLQPAIYPPPVVVVNNAPFHLLTADSGPNAIVNDSISVINFTRNMQEINVGIWYPGGAAVTYVLFAFDERGALIGSNRRDAIGVPTLYQLDFKSVERPIRQLVIEARPVFAGEFSPDYRFSPVLPTLLTRVELRYTTP
jgi:pSer/pThr/pTyr-binding forkhead associated (FHA) protein